MTSLAPPHVSLINEAILRAGLRLHTRAVTDTQVMTLSPGVDRRVDVNTLEMTQIRHTCDLTGQRQIRRRENERLDVLTRSVTHWAISLVTLISYGCDNVLKKCSKLKLKKAFLTIMFNLNNSLLVYVSQKLKRCLIFLTEK